MFQLVSVESVNPRTDAEVFQFISCSIDSLNAVGKRIPLHVDMFAGLLCAPIGTGRIVIIVVSLPYKRRICGMTHPYQQTGGIIPHFVVPGFIHAFHVLNIYKLGLIAELFKRLGRAPAFIDSLSIVRGLGVPCFLTEKMLVPDIVIILFELFVGRERPLVFFRNEQFYAFIHGECSHANFRSHAVAVISAVRIGGGVERKIAGRRLKVMAGWKIRPPAASRQAVLIGAGFVHTVISVFTRHRQGKRIVKIASRMSLVGTAPQGNARVIAQAANLVDGICLEGLRLGHIVISHIKPEVVPYHDSVTVAPVIELVVGDTSRPEAYHVVVHILVEPYLLLVVIALTAQQIFAHAPVATLDKYFFTVDVKGQHGHARFVGLCLIIILPDAEIDSFLLKQLFPVLDLQVEGIEIRLTVTVRPPKPRI